MKDSILKLSASRVKSFRQCPRKYYYTYIKRLPKKEWDHFDLGTLVHGTLEAFHGQYKCDDEKPNIRKLMTECFKKQRDSMIANGSKLSFEIVSEAKDMLSGYLKRLEEKGIGAKIIEIEKAFDISLNSEYVISGCIDRIDIDSDGVFHIKDYKTNKNAKYMESFQLQVYGIPLMQWNPEIEKFRCSYIMLKFEGMHISYEFSRSDVEKVKRILIEDGNKITEEQKWIAKPSPLCDYCDFKDTCLTEW